MGAGQSSEGSGAGPSDELISTIEKETNFKADEIRRLHRRFQKLDTEMTGAITRDDFLNIPELAANPLISRIVSVFDVDNENVNFQEFTRALSVFSTGGSREEKLRFAFKIYDIEGDGFITNPELFTVLKLMVGSNLTNGQLQQIVDKTMIEADRDLDGKISYDEFLDVVADADLDTKLTIQF